MRRKKEEIKLVSVKDKVSIRKKILDILEVLSMKLGGDKT